MADSNPTQAAELPEWYYHNPRAEMLKYVPQNIRTLLDVGCGSGEFAGLVAQHRNAEIWGVEINSEAAAKAGPCFHRILIGDVAELKNELPTAYFDCIVFNDVLEHLANPYQMLANVKSLLRPGGCIVGSLPNMRYFPVLKALVREKDFRYADYGVMDRTHLRFFTRKSIARMFEEQGFAVQTLEGINSLQSWKFEVLNALLLNSLSDARCQQFAWVAKPK